MREAEADGILVSKGERARSLMLRTHLRKRPGQLAGRRLAVAEAFENHPVASDQRPRRMSPSSLSSRLS